MLVVVRDIQEVLEVMVEEELVEELLSTILTTNI